MRGRFAWPAFALLAAFTLRSEAQADQLYLPAQQSIEQTCNALAKDPPGTKKVYLIRVRGSDGSDGPWQHSDDGVNARLEAGTVGPGDTVTIRQSDTALLAILTSNKTGTSVTHGWCFLGGQLSRANIAFPDAAANVFWRRAQYFQGDPEKPLADIIVPEKMDPQSTVAPPQPASNKLPIDTYRTPSKLPFYDAYRAALAGSLPAYK